MSRNGSGTYSLPAGNPVVTATTITSTWANTTLSDIATALTGSLAADGQTPATGSLNMNTNRIINVVDPTLAQDAATKAYVDTANGLALLKANNLSDVANATTSRTNLSAAKSGANSDITSITGLTTALSAAQGGTGVTTSTGSGANVLGTSPTIASPTITGNITDGTYTTSSTTVIQGSARAWVKFNGNGSISGVTSFNVSSVVRNSTGNYTVNFTNAFSDANYSSPSTISYDLSSSGSITVLKLISQTTTAVSVFSAAPAGGAVDSQYIAVACFR